MPNVCVKVFQIDQLQEINLFLYAYVFLLLKSLEK